MPRAPTNANGAAQRAREIIASTSDIDALRIAHAVLLPMEGMTLEQTAQLVGRDKYWVSRTRNRFIRGEEALGKHGGRRNAYFNAQQERELVRDALAEHAGQTYAEGRKTTIRETLLSKLHAKKLPVAESTITDMLDRYTGRILPGVRWGDLGWHQDALARLALVELQVMSQPQLQRGKRRELNIAS